MHSIPCSCGGDNANCFKCDGTGMVARAAQQLGRPHPAPGQLPPAAKRASARSRPAKQSKPPRPTTAARTESPKLDWSARRSTTAAAAADPPVQLCPDCGIYVRRLERHRGKVHGAAAEQRRSAQEQARVAAAAAKAARPAAASQTPRDPAIAAASKARRRARRALARQEAMVDEVKNCPPGKSRVWRADDPQPRRVPPSNLRPAKSSLNTSGARATTSTQRGESASSRGANRAAQEDSGAMDAKARWGGSFRDNGQFGSYPSHDDMGDESSS